MEFHEFTQLWNNADYKFRLALVIMDYLNKCEKHIISIDEFTTLVLRNLSNSLFVNHRIHNGLIQNLKDAGIIMMIESYTDEINAFSLTQFGVNLIFYNQKKINSFIEENNIDFTVLPISIHYI
jgi:hypothetical protein